jgi:CRISPR system Cascade subunit CasE
MEPENMTVGSPRILIQSRSLPDWSRIGIKGWLKREPDPAIDIDERLGLGAIRSGQKFRFRLRANPSVCRGGKRLGLMKTPEQEKWLFRKGKDYHGFDLPSLKRVDDEEEGQVLRLGVAISQEQILRSKKRGNDHEICVFSVLYDGTLIVSDPEKFRSAVLGGIGHGKAMGLGLLSVASAG